MYGFDVDNSMSSKCVFILRAGSCYGPTATKGLNLTLQMIYKRKVPFHARCSLQTHSQVLAEKTFVLGSDLSC